MGISPIHDHVFGHELHNLSSFFCEGIPVMRQFNTFKFRTTPSLHKFLNINSLNADQLKLFPSITRTTGINPWACSNDIFFLFVLRASVSIIFVVNYSPKNSMLPFHGLAHGCLPERTQSPLIPYFVK